MRIDFLPRFQHTLAVIGAGVGIASAGYGIYKGIKSDKERKKDLAEKESLQRPVEKVQNEYYQDRNILGQEASGGLTDATKNFAENQIGRGLSGGVRALQSGGGDMNLISKLFDNYSTKTADLANEDSQQHIRNIQYYTQANKDLAGQKTIQYGVNELQPYENKLKELSGRIVADKQNAENGYQQGIGSLASSITSLSNTNFGKKTTSSAEDPYVPPSTYANALSSTGTDIDTSRALAKYLTRTSGDLTIGGTPSGELTPEQIAQIN